MRLEAISLPWDNALPLRIARTSDGHVWDRAHQRGTLGRSTPTSGQTVEVPFPSR